MKVNYLPKNRLKFPYWKRILVLLVIFFAGTIVFSFLGSTIVSLVSPVWEAENVIVSGENVTPVIDRRTKSGLIVATVLTYPPQTPYDIIIIDIGSNDSVVIGGEVSMSEGPLLGLVSEVFSRRAKVKLFSASGEETSAILERNDMPITLEGRGGGNFRISLPRDMEIEKGDRILSADISARLMAIVEDVTVQPTDAFKEVLAKSPTNIFALRFFFLAP